MAETSAAQHSRKVAFTQLARLAEAIETDGDKWTEIQISIKLSLLENYFAKFDNDQTCIEQLGDISEVEHRNKFEDIYSSLKEKLLTLKASYSRPDPDNCASSSQSNGTTKLKSVLPTIQLPKFEGCYSKWCDFINMFKTVVDDDSQLSGVEKFQILRSCLAGTASSVIRSLECTNENYQKALELLNNRYSNTRLIFGAHINEILNAPPVNKGSVHQLRNLVDFISGEMRALQSLGSKEQIAEVVLINIIASKLDSGTRARWEESADLNEIPKWDKFIEFLQKRCQTMEHVHGTQLPHDNSSSTITRKRDNAGRLLTFISTQSPNRRCCFCQMSNHLLSKCSQYLNLTSKERYKLIKRLKLCINCLRTGHSLKDCKSSSCLKCSQRHHTTLHFNAPYLSEAAPINAQTDTEVNKGGNPFNSKYPSNCLSATNRESAINGKDIIIATAVVNVSSFTGVKTSCRILLDSASQSHFITERLAQQMNLKKFRCNSSISGIGSIETNVNKKVQIIIESRDTAFKIMTEALVLQNITANQPSDFIDIKDWMIPNNINLADPNFNQPGRIDLLLGAEFFMPLMCVGQINLGAQRPVLQKTLFGWVVSGATHFQNRQDNTSACLAVNRAVDDQPIENLLRKFWEIEEVQNYTKPLTLEERRCEEYFRNTTCRNREGRFIVRLPFKESPETLGQSLDMAKLRFSYLQRKFDKNPEFKNSYQDFMKEYEELKHMEPCEQTTSKSKMYYMPHHGIEQTSGPSKKLRVVFDASCKTTSGKSLNDILMVGPVVQEDLFSILCRFRKHQYVLTADIIKMYRQILIHPDDTSVQSILWQNQTSGSTTSYRLNTVTYGTASAPYLATRCIKELSSLHKDEFPIASKILERDMYVDDVLTGANSTEQVNEIRSQLSKSLLKAGMRIHKWCTNSNEILMKIDNITHQQLTIIKDGQITKTLGMRWQPNTDQFLYHVEKDKNIRKATKRSVLSVIASLFDPLGLINPIIVSAKIFMQELWKLKVDWDESLPLDLHSKWMKFLDNLDVIDKIKINRFVMSNSCSDIQLHGFSDASQSAYGACVFLRVINTSGQTSVNLLCAKSRVAPVKTQTLPRLELCGAVLLIELVDKVVSSLDIEFSAIYCWTDSTVALSWIAGSPSVWNVFVSHRVSNIQLKSERHLVKWKHISTHENPADILSRGASSDQLRGSKLWFHGPLFLSKTENEWPKTDLITPVLLERKKKGHTLLVKATNDLVTSCKFINSYRKLIRTFAHIFKFMSGCRNLKLSTSKELELDELSSGEKLIIRVVQNSYYKSEIEALKKGKKILGSSHIKSLDPFIDDENLIRVGGRLHHANIEFDARHPILLPRTHPFAKSLIRYLHEKHMHVGCLTLHNIVRQRYWIPNVRQLIRSIIHNCVKCFRFKPNTLQQMMATLPKERIQPAHPFAHAGVDYCGPFTIKPFNRSKSLMKAYVALFICFSTKAVHLELVTNLSTDAFIAALKRFIGRRGKCFAITSDNATNFVGAKRELSELRELFLSESHSNTVKEFCQTEGIRWQFIPPRSPHFGGLWEASIKKAKLLLVKTLKAEPLNYEEFNTILIQVESILNSRPLTPISTDPNDAAALTPAHFLIGRTMESVPEPNITNLKISRLSRWQHVCRLQQIFWQRWSKEYLNTLQQRHKWSNLQKNITNGTLVLLKEENHPPCTWILGRITNTIEGDDGCVRVADVKTPQGVYRRSIHKLCVLPITDDDADIEVPSRRGAC